MDGNRAAAASQAAGEYSAEPDGDLNGHIKTVGGALRGGKERHCALDHCL